MRCLKISSMMRYLWLSYKMSKSNFDDWDSAAKS